MWCNFNLTTIWTLNSKQNVKWWYFNLNFWVGAQFWGNKAQVILVENCFEDEFPLWIVELMFINFRSTSEMTLKGVLNTLIEYETPRYVKVTKNIELIKRMQKWWQITYNLQNNPNKYQNDTLEGVFVEFPSSFQIQLKLIWGSPSLFS